MKLICLDLEGFWYRKSGSLLRRRAEFGARKNDEGRTDYDKLMRWRLSVLKEHGLGLKEIQETIASIDPLPGAKVSG